MTSVGATYTIAPGLSVHSHQLRQMLTSMQTLQASVYVSF